MPEPWRVKIHSYLAWQRKSRGDSWPKYPPLPEGIQPPGIAERIGDRTRYRFWRGFDAFTRLAFCLLPLPLLRAYRQRKAHSSAPLVTAS